MEQTAVEQFIEQLEKQGESWENVSMGTINISIKVDDYLKLKTQAKEMEKQQIIDAYERKHNDNSQLVRISLIHQTSVGEQYYNETFKSE